MVRVSWPLFVPLLVLHAVVVVRLSSGDNLVRKRREWILPPKPLKENVDYTQEESIARIRSDFENDVNIRYSLEGPGANLDPFHVFIVDPQTGNIRVTKVLDREFIDMYNLSGIASFSDGRHAEKKIDIRIKVVDENDNPPVFHVLPHGKVNELSAVATSVMKIFATDADEPNTPNSQIAYSIVSQDPDHDMFSIEPNGTIYVKRPTLDRELADTYVLNVKGQDLNGKPEGKTGTGTVIIEVLDVNDNLPTLEKDEYEGSIEENTEGVEVMRIKAEDLDLEGTENWEAVFDIVKGNEAGYFSIKTDPVTNEGILMLIKAVDYEDVQNLELGLAVRNKAESYGSWASSASSASSASAASAASASSASSASGISVVKKKSYPIKIKVKNQPEGPRFNPKVKAIPISEGGSSVSINQIIARYPAIDGDTGELAENVRYAKGSDPGNWLFIDPKTADIKLNKMPDRESPFLVNGTYFANVLCITEDMQAKTATGTVAIQVEDFNDNCPTLTNNIQTMCTTADAVIVNAKDEDAFPNGPPFDFAIVPEGTEGKWQVEHLNDTAAILRAQGSVWPGLYKVELLVKDNQGEVCPQPQRVTIKVCTCEDGEVCAIRSELGKKPEFGPAGIGLLLLGLLLLALIPLLLLFCQCGAAAGLPGGFTEMPFDTKSHLINYRTEGQGENTEVPLMAMPSQINAVDAGFGTTTARPIEQFRAVSIENGAIFGAGQSEWGMSDQRRTSGFYSEYEFKNSAGGGGIYDGIALPHYFLEQYYSKKVMSGNENFGVKDGLLVYDYEGQGSPAGSVGCCSLLESDNDLQFLDDLGLKFKTLAEVCGGKTIQTEVKPVLSPTPSTRISTLTSGSRLTTAPQLSPPPKVQPTISTTEQTVVQGISERSQIVKESMSAVGGGIASQGQMLLLQQQQPVYYTTTPVLQPMHYVVQPQVQNTMLLAEAPATNLQGMVLVNGSHTGTAPGMVVQGQTVMSTGPSQSTSMVLVESSRIQGDGANLIHTGNLPASQPMMIMEGKVPAGTMKVLKGSQTCLVQGGTLQPGGLSGSQRVLMVGGATGSGGQLVQETQDLSKMSNISHTSSTMVSTTPTYHKVVKETREIH